MTVPVARPCRRRGATLLVLALLTASAPACDRPRDPEATPPSGFDFAVVGDTPYTPGAERVFPVLVEEVSGAPVAFIVHVGDIKGSYEPCADSLVASRVRDLDRFAHPLVYVPGDNEWTDCHREGAGRYRPLERLAYLRTLAYPEAGRTRGAPSMAVESQTGADGIDFPEHQRWSHQGVLFATIHAVGSLNGLVPFDGRTPGDDDEVARRIAASVAWLRETFALARERKAVAVVVATQADPWDVPADHAGPTGFDEILTTLREEADRFLRPVLLIHGDTHTLRVDRPFWSEEEPKVPNLMRLETFGDPDVGWIQVHVDPASRGVFGYTPHRMEPLP